MVLNKSDYNKKVENILNDQKIYKVLSKNTIDKIARNLIDLLKNLKKSKSINDNTYRNLYPSHYNIPQVYALIKIHKTGNPCRIICPNFNDPQQIFQNF